MQGQSPSPTFTVVFAEETQPGFYGWDTLILGIARHQHLVNEHHRGLPIEHSTLVEIRDHLEAAEDMFRSTDRELYPKYEQDLGVAMEIVRKARDGYRPAEKELDELQKALANACTRGLIGANMLSAIGLTLDNSDVVLLRAIWRLDELFRRRGASSQCYSGDLDRDEVRTFLSTREPSHFDAAMQKEYPAMLALASFAWGDKATGRAQLTPLHRKALAERCVAS